MVRHHFNIFKSLKTGLHADPSQSRHQQELLTITRHSPPKKLLPVWSPKFVTTGTPRTFTEHVSAFGSFGGHHRSGATLPPHPTISRADATMSAVASVFSRVGHAQLDAGEIADNDDHRTIINDLHRNTEIHKALPGRVSGKFSTNVEHWFAQLGSKFKSKKYILLAAAVGIFMYTQF